MRVPCLALLLAGQSCLLLAVAPGYTPPRKDLGFPVYTNQPSGKQLAGQHVPASTPALSPEEAQRRFTLPDGFEIRLFASEPEVANPVAMTWDERGRLWVVELYEYPLGAPQGARPRDRIKILEDTNADGRADQVHVWADGLNLATGILLGYGGAFVGQAPDLLFLEDTDGDGKADKRTVLKTGFGLQDRHELLNGFTWGPDGWLYMTHGVFTQSRVKDPNNQDDDGVVMNAAVARYHPRTHRFEVFADGTSNPWGVDFDRYGNAFVSACVIDHLFHMAPGGLYVRQGGTWANPYAYADMHSPRGGLPSIVDHRHHMAAYSGVQVYEGDQYPAEHRGTILMGNIHANAVHQDVLTPNGSSFKASFKQDFVVANDGWFMPVSEQVGPDGCLWIMDWYDKYPCYQNARADPEGVDREHGRIWRVVYVGKDKGKPVPSRPQRHMDLAKLNSAELVKLLGHPNVWQRRMAQRILSERTPTSAASNGGGAKHPNDPPGMALRTLLKHGKSLEARLSALWTLHSCGLLEEKLLDEYAADREPAIRAWVARLTGERGSDAGEPSARLGTLAGDPDSAVRLAVAVACRQLISRALTVDVPVGKPADQVNIAGTLEKLARVPGTADDPLLPFMIWTAGEPYIAANPQYGFDWLLENGPATLPLSAQFARKILRRASDLRQPEKLKGALPFIAGVAEKSVPLAVAALDGLLEGQRGKALVPAGDVTPVLNRLLASRDPQIRERAQRLGALWGNAAAMQASLAFVKDSKVPLNDRLKAMEAVSQTNTPAIITALVIITACDLSQEMRAAAIRALGRLNYAELPDLLVGGSTTRGVPLWTRELKPETRAVAAEILASRPRWASSLLSALEQKLIPAGDIPATTIRMLLRSDADFGMLAKRAAQVFGKVRDADQDKLKIIAARRQMILANPSQPDLNAGHELARKTCLTCHKLHGEGADVGPDLTGVGRSSLDALLANVIDPNQIIGAGYENVEIETKDGRLVSGRMVENSDTRVRLLAAGPKEEVVARSDIGSLRVSELSVMPEGLEQMPDADFRNLVGYILNPPGDNQPFSWKHEERRSLDAGAVKSKVGTAP